MCAELAKVSASIIVNLPWQERVFSAGQRLPHVIREDQKVSRGNCRDLPIPDGVVLALIAARGRQALPQPLEANMIKTAEFRTLQIIYGDISCLMW